MCTEEKLSLFSISFSFAGFFFLLSDFVCLRVCVCVFVSRVIYFFRFYHTVHSEQCGCYAVANRRRIPCIFAISISICVIHKCSSYNIWSDDDATQRPKPLAANLYVYYLFLFGTLLGPLYIILHYTYCIIRNII